MNQDLNVLLGKQLANKVAKEIDLDKLAKKMAPQLEKELIQAMFKSVKSMDFGDWIFDNFSKNFDKATEELFIRALRKLK